MAFDDLRRYSGASASTTSAQAITTGAWRWTLRLEINRMPGQFGSLGKEALHRCLGIGQRRNFFMSPILSRPCYQPLSSFIRHSRRV